MSNSDIKLALLRKTKEPERALRVEINMELGKQNQLRIKKAAESTSISVQNNSVYRTENKNRLNNQSHERPISRNQCENCCQAW